MHEHLNVEVEPSVEAYPTLVADEQERLTCMSVNVVNPCDHSTV